MAVRLQEPVPRSLKPFQFDARLDFAKLLDQIVAFLASRQRFHIRSDSASQIDQALFERRAVIELMAQHTVLQFKQRSLATMEWPRRCGRSGAGAIWGNVAGAASGVQ